MKNIENLKLSTKSLSSKFSLVVIIIAVIGMTIATLLLYSVQKSVFDKMVADARGNLVEKGDRLLNFISNVAVRSINNYDFDSLSKYAEEAIKDKDISKVVFVDTEGKLITEKSSEHYSQNDEKLSQDIMSDNNKIGTVEIYMNAAELKKDIEKIEKENLKALRKFLFVLVLILIIESFFLFFGMSATFKNLISKRLELITNSFKLISDGDLTTRLDISLKDEVSDVANWMNVFIVKIAEIISEVRKTVLTLSSAAEEMASSTKGMASLAENISKGIEVQASAATETSSSMENMDKSTNQINESAIKLSELYVATEKQIGAGEKSINDVIGNINQIETDSRNIDKIISVLSEIARQTNLLALNAAIEAAKAGESGRGFAVVADEVRKLAERSAESAKEIRGIIDNSANIIKNGVKIAGEAGTSFLQIAESIKKTSDFIKDISATTQKQINTSSEVTKAIEELASESEKNATAVLRLSGSTDEIARASNELSKMAENLNMLVNKFKVA